MQRPLYAWALCLTATVLCVAGFLWWADAAQGTFVDGANTRHPVAPSLAGTDVDGKLQFFAHLQSNPSALGQVPNEALKRMFDYHLSAIGEVDEATALKSIEQEIAKHFSGAQAAAARRLLDAYVNYQKAIAQLEQQLAKQAPTQGEPDVAMLRKRYEAMRQLRAQFFDSRQHQEMFGSDEAYDGVALSQLEVSQDPRLSAAQKASRLQTIHEQMPAHVRAELEAPRQILVLGERVEQLRAQGASDDEVYRLRAQSASPEAAARLAEFDREEADWRQRIAHYLAQRQRVMQSPEGGAAHKQALIEQLRAQLFAAHEWPRLVAYEQ